MTRLRHTPACDEPYTRVNLHELVAYYREHVTGR